MTHAPISSHDLGPGGSMHIGSPGAQSAHGAPHGLPMQGSNGGGHSGPIHGHIIGPGTHAPSPSHWYGPGPGGGQLGSEGAHIGSQGAPQGFEAHGGGGGGQPGASATQL